MNAVRATACGLLLVCLPSLSAWAGPWETPSAQGLVVRIEQDAYRTRDGYVLTRRYADGSLDAQFAEQGSTVFSLGPDNEGPAALRVDAQGRIWVAGASAGSGDRLEAVVLRFGALGRPDRGYAAGGRSAVRPAGRAARALDVAPMPDGSAYVAGIVLDASGQERSGWWRLLPDGTVDRQFGLGGLWADSGTGSTEVLDLLPGGDGSDGSLTLRLRRGSAPDAPVETWLLPAGARMPRLAGGVARVSGGAGSGPAGLVVAAGMPSAPVTLGNSPSDAPGAAATPGPAAIAAVDAPFGSETALWVACTGAAVLGLAWLWRRWRR